MFFPIHSLQFALAWGNRVEIRRRGLTSLKRQMSGFRAAREAGGYRAKFKKEESPEARAPKYGSKFFSSGL